MYIRLIVLKFKKQIIFYTFSIFNTILIKYNTSVPIFVLVKRLLSLIKKHLSQEIVKIIKYYLGL